MGFLKGSTVRWRRGRGIFETGTSGPAFPHGSIHRAVRKRAASGALPFRPARPFGLFVGARAVPRSSLGLSRPLCYGCRRPSMRGCGRRTMFPARKAERQKPSRPRQSHDFQRGICRPYLSSTLAPAFSSWSLILLASSLSTPSLTGFGALSTRSLASLRPRPVSARTSLMTLIF